MTRQNTANVLQNYQVDHDGISFSKNGAVCLTIAEETATITEETATIAEQTATMAEQTAVIAEETTIIAEAITVLYFFDMRFRCISDRKCNGQFCHRTNTCNSLDFPLVVAGTY